jgi:small conductance mechanosensitive channel
MLLAIALGGVISVGILPVSAQERPAAPIPAPSPSGGAPTSPIAFPFRELAPPEVKDIFERTVAEKQLAAVYLDGRPLFEVATTGEEGLSAKARAREIEERLARMARSLAAQPRLDDLAVTIELDEESNQPVIYVNGENLMTITYLDALLKGNNSMTIEAEQVAAEVQVALEQYHRERQAEYLWRQVRRALGVIAVAAIATLLLRLLYRWVDRRRNHLRSVQPNQEGEQRDTHLTTPTVEVMRTQLTVQQRIKTLGLLRVVLRLAEVALWISSGLLLLGLFPYTRWLQPLSLDFLQLPLRLGLVGLIAYGLIRLSGGWVDWLLIVLQGDREVTTTRSQRLMLRLSTFSQVIKGLVAFIIGGIAFLVMLSWLGVRIAPLLAGAGLLGFAVSFASQSLIKDFINGFLILLEDQYGVGDVINVNGFSGFVETMNLRITQVRATEGQLITIPNGQIAIVQNLSKEWSRVDILVPVSLEADINQALQLIEQVANEMRRDRLWNSLILEPPLLLGVDNLDHTGASIRLWIKTLPLKQWDVAREYRRRLKIAFVEAKIPIGLPQQLVRLSDMPTQEALASAEILTASKPVHQPPRVS